MNPSTWRDPEEMTDNEKHAVIEAAQQGEPGAIDYAWHLYLGLIKQYLLRRWHVPRWRESFEENLQLMVPSFMAAVRNFEPCRGYTFTTFLVSYLPNGLNAIQSHYIGYNRRQTLALRIWRELLEQERIHGSMRAVDLDVVAEACDSTIESVQGVLDRMSQKVPLINEEGRVLEFPDRSPTPEDAAIWHNQVEMLEELLERLPPRMAYVLRARSNGVRFREIAAALQTSRPSAQLLEVQGLRLLRRWAGVRRELPNTLNQSLSA